MTTHPDATGLLAAIDAGDRFALALLCDWAEENMSPLAPGLRALRDGGKWPELSPFAKLWDFWTTGFAARASSALQLDWMVRLHGCHPTTSAAILEAAAAWRPGEDA